MRVHAVLCMLHSCVHGLGAMGWLVWFSVSRLLRRQRLEAAAGSRCRESGAGWLGSTRRGEARRIPFNFTALAGGRQPSLVPCAMPLPADGPNDEGEMFERPGKLSDKLPAPYMNEVCVGRQAGRVTCAMVAGSAGETGQGSGGRSGCAGKAYALALPSCLLTQRNGPVQRNARSTRLGHAYLPPSLPPSLSAGACAVRQRRRIPS